MADEFQPIDTTDVDATLELARAHAVCGVMTAGTDVAVPTLGRVVDELGLPGPGYETALLCSNKVRMKQALARADIPTATFAVVTTLDEATAAADRIGYPVMIKAVDSSGSRGITRVDRVGELEAAWQAAVAVSRVPEFLVEQCLEGLEFGAQCILVGTEAVLTMPHNDQVTPPPLCTPYGHSLPADLPSRAVASIDTIGARIGGAFGLRDTAVNLDLMWADGEVYVLEVGARIGATCLPELVGAYAGFDLYEALVQLAVGQSPALSVNPGRPVAGALIRGTASGVVEAIHVPEALRNDPDVLEWQVDLEPGDAARAFRTGPDRLGHIIVRGDTVANAERKVADYAAGVVVTLARDAAEGMP